MELGFNLSTHQIEEMDKYEVITTYFDFEEEFMKAPLHKGVDNLEYFFSSLTMYLEENKNYNIIVKINNEEELGYDEYYTLFSAFTFSLANLGTENNKGFLKVKEQFLDQIISTEFSLLRIMNRDYNFGAIQLIIEDNNGYYTKWIETK